LTRPVCAFITFDSDDGYEEALRYSRRNWFQRRLAEYRGEEDEGVDAALLGRAVTFTAASEPTNIIWENRHIKGANYYARFTAAVIWLAALIAGAFFIIFLAKRSSIVNQQTFSGANCYDYAEEIFTQNPEWLVGPGAFTE